MPGREEKSHHMHAPFSMYTNDKNMQIKNLPNLSPTPRTVHRYRTSAHASYSYSTFSTPANTVTEAALADPSLASKYERRSDVICFSWVQPPSLTAGSLLRDQGSPGLPVDSPCRYRPALGSPGKAIRAWVIQRTVDIDVPTNPKTPTPWWFFG